MNKLKSGDKVWVSLFIKNEKPAINQLEIEGFRHGLGLIEYTTGFQHHFSKYWFYASGYHSDGFAIVTLHRWQIPFAWLQEKIRLALPRKVAIFLKMEEK